MKTTRITLAALALVVLPAIAQGETTKLPSHGEVRWDLNLPDKRQIITTTYTVVGNDCEETPYLYCAILQRGSKGEWTEVLTTLDTTCTLGVPWEGGQFRYKVTNTSSCTLKVAMSIRPL